MPRDSSGNYTLPATGNPVLTGTTISSTWANMTFNDLAAEMTDSLDRSGKGGMLAAFKFADGTVSLPGAAFTNEPATGFYRAGANNPCLAIGGALAFSFGLNSFAAPAYAPVVTTAPAFGIYAYATNSLAIVTSNTTRVTINSSGLMSFFNNVYVTGNNSSVNGLTIGTSYATGGAISFNDYLNSAQRGYIGYGPAVITGAAMADLCLVSTGGNLRFGVAGGGSTAAYITTSGNFLVNAPAAGVALTATGLAGSYAVAIQGALSSGNSDGLSVQAGYTSGDFCAKFINAIGTVEYFRVQGDGQVYLTDNAASPTLQKVGYLIAPQNLQTASYQLVLADAGKEITVNAAGATTLTIPANGTVAFPIGTVIPFTNLGAGTLTISITTDTMYLAGSSSTGNRTVGQYGVGFLKKVGATTWMCSGVGVS